MLLPGSDAPDIELPDIDGTRWSLREALRKGPVVLVFFKISCPTCQFTFPFLQRLCDAPFGSRGAGVPLIAVSQDDVPDSREFHQRLGISIPTLIDSAPGYAASRAYRITSVPSVFVVETDGKISSATEGFSKAALEKLGERFGGIPFNPNDRVPSLRPG